MAVDMYLIRTYADLTFSYDLSGVYGLLQSVYYVLFLIVFILR